MVAVDYNIRGNLTVDNENQAQRQSANRNMGKAPGSFLSLMARFAARSAVSHEGET
ncbi:MAG TPA: hypothetical protein VK854_07020 [Woeseiaceae bacterium]|nr:hypothetical protein [Woeseiaceae bacterium]